MKDIWVSLSGAIAQQRNVETIANNVANANTPGFKKDKLIFKEYLTALEKGNKDIDLPNKEWKPEDFYKSHGAENAFVKIDGSYTIHEQGQLSPTGNPLDLGIHGKGFFEILTPNGIRYTRNGTFSIDKSGALVTTQGHKVLSSIDWTKFNNLDTTNPENLPKLPPPQERTINISKGKVAITFEGDIYINGKTHGQISINEFNDIQALRKEGSAMFINPDANNLRKKTLTSKIHQGFVEQSNVNPLAEMSALIRANRNFESIQRAIKTYDNIAGKAVNEISRF